MNNDKREKLPKTKKMTRGIKHCILSTGCPIVIVCFVLVLLDLAWVFPNKTIGYAARAIELLVGLELLAGFLSYNKQVKKTIQKRKDFILKTKNFNKDLLLKEVDKEHSNIQIDMLVSCSIACFCMGLVMTVVSWGTNTWAHWFDTHFAQGFILSIIHVALVITPLFIWNKDEIDVQYFSTNSLFGLNAYTPKMSAPKINRKGVA